MANGQLGEPLRVAVAGLGTVGSGVIDTLDRNASDISGRAGRPIAVVAVSARDRDRERAVDISACDWLDDPVRLANHDGIDAVVEVIGGEGNPALALQRAALARGRHVVTANKALLAHHGQELAEHAERSGATLAFEAAVAGGIPVIKGIAEGLSANAFTRICGVLNGTCNYILTEMERTGAAYPAVLSEAQCLGYAEADPAADVGGFDAAHKLALLAALAFGTRVDFGGLSIQGVERVEAVDIEYARTLGYRIRLLGVARAGPSGLEQRVQPCLVPADSAIGSLQGVGNMVVAEGEPVGRVVFEGPGAGGGATASAIVADLIDIARGIRRPPFGVPAAALRTIERQPRESRMAAYYVRLLLRDSPGVLAQVAGALGAAGVSIDRLSQARPDVRGARVLIVTHETLRADLDRAADAIESLDACLEEPRVMRIEGL